jgi:hypothetical protein
LAKTHLADVPLELLITAAKFLPNQGCETIGTFTYAVPACPYRNRQSESMSACRDGRRHRLENQDRRVFCTEDHPRHFCHPEHRRIRPSQRLDVQPLVVTLHLVLREQAWLIAKLVALILYIVFGVIALRRGRTMQIRATAFVAALLAYLYIAGVALSKSPTSWMAFFGS